MDRFPNAAYSHLPIIFRPLSPNQRYSTFPGVISSGSSSANSTRAIGTSEHSTEAIEGQRVVRVGSQQWLKSFSFDFLIPSSRTIDDDDCHPGFKSYYCFCG